MGAGVRRRLGVKKVVQVGPSAVAVVATTWWTAKTALDALQIEWDYGPHAAVSQADIHAMVRGGLDLSTPATSVGNSNGDAMAAITAAPKYQIPPDFSGFSTMRPRLEAASGSGGGSLLDAVPTRTYCGVAKTSSPRSDA